LSRGLFFSYTFDSRMPGAAPEKFYFTVRDDAVAGDLNKVMGRRVSLFTMKKRSACRPPASVIRDTT
jgi:hypothetical protein